VQIPGIIIIKVEEPLYFANIEQIKEMFRRIEHLGSHLAHPSEKRSSSAPDVRALIVHAKNMQEVDPSAIQVFYEMLEDYHKRNITVCFVKLKSHLVKPFKNAKLITHENERFFYFQTVQEAVAAVDKEV